jgi:uncharacterized damage-inducible protein DinB
MTTTAAAPAIGSIPLIFTLNDGLMTRALDGLSDEECSRPLTDRTNSLLWILSHAVDTRAFMLRQLGDPYDTGWGALFARGAALDPNASYPSREQVTRAQHEVSERLRARLASLDEATLATPATDLNLPGAKTVADVIAFFALHDSYHVGQMALVRKGLGHSQLVG